jgi:hypothetical protein
VPQSTATLVELDVALATVRDRIARHERENIGEQDTKAALIVPVLRALGWDVEDLEDVKLEYRRRPSDNPVDYALFLLRTPRLFIEAKSLGSHLDDGKWALQILNYATAAGVEWVALTDGNEWRIYNSHATVPVEQKLFRVVRIAEPRARAEDTLRLLAKAQMADHLIDDLWKSDFIDRQVREALLRLFGPEPEPSLVRLVRSKTRALSPSEVRKSLGRLRTTFDFPVVTAVAPERTEPSPQSRREVSKPVASRSGPKAYGEGTPWRHTSLAELIEGGILRVPLEIERRYRGAELTAQIETADRIVVGTTAYDSLSTAGGMARKSVPGSPTRRPHPQTNGWTFWQYRGADGALHLLDELRRQLYEGKVVSLPSGRRVG